MLHQCYKNSIVITSSLYMSSSIKTVNKPLRVFALHYLVLCVHALMDTVIQCVNMYVCCYITLEDDKCVYC